MRGILLLLKVTLYSGTSKENINLRIDLHIFDGKNPFDLALPLVEFANVGISNSKILSQVSSLYRGGTNHTIEYATAVHFPGITCCVRDPRAVAHFHLLWQPA